MPAHDPASGTEVTFDAVLKTGVKETLTLTPTGIASVVFTPAEDLSSGNLEVHYDGHTDRYLISLTENKSGVTTNMGDWRIDFTALHIPEPGAAQLALLGLAGGLLLKS